MTGTAQAARILIRGGRVYDHDGDVHQPAQADILIGGERIERIGPELAGGRPASKSSTPRASWSCLVSSTPITIRTT
jgi:hypothetical protein